MKEIWKKIPSREGYEASNLGRIKSFLTDKENGRLLNSRSDKDGYQMVWTKYNGFDRVHRLVAITFLEESYEEGLVINHKNGIKTDNRVENLEWVTISENTKHGYDIGLSHSSVSQSIGVYHENKLISVFNSLNKLSNYCNINRNTIAECVKNNLPIFDELYIKPFGKTNQTNHELYEKPFIFKPLKRYQTQTCSYGDNYFQSINELSDWLKVPRSKVVYCLEKGKEINGVIPKKITRYEYVKQYGFND